jgi:sulfite exporter TauE/SafE
MESIGIITALLMGITGSLHCAGMCGPIVMVMQFQFLEGWKRAAGIALYHIGRTSVYAALGAVLFSVKSVFTPQVQQYVSIGLGSFLLVLGVLTFLPNVVRVKLPWANFVTGSIGKFLAKPGLKALFMSGVLNGLLPCGLVYMALSASMVTNTVIEAITFMYAFGAGTVPVLVFITVFKTRLKLFNEPSVKRLIPIMMFAFGTLFVMRGLNLGIPMLSPKITVEQAKITTSCCHKH